MNTQEALLKADDEIAGYRVLRTLGVGARSRVYLGHSGAGAAAVAVKVFKPEVGNADIALEIDAYERTAGQHIARLLDVCTTDRGESALILERASGGSLAALMRSRPRMRSGEAVTILICVFRGVLSMHSAGFVHRSLSAASVYFDATGRPLLLGLGHAASLDRLDRSGRVAAIRECWGRFNNVAHAVLDRVESEGHDGSLTRLNEAIDAIADSRDQANSAVSFEDAAFAFAQPAPVVLQARAPAGAVRVPRAAAVTQQGDSQGHSVGATTDLGANSSTERSAGGSARVSRATHRTHRAPRGKRHSAGTSRPRSARVNELFIRADAVLEAGPTRAVRAKLAGVVGRRRKPLVVAIGVASAIAIAGLASIPPHSSAGSAAHSAPQQMTPSATAHSPARSTSRSTTQPTTAVEGEDPVDAVRALLAMRQKCITKRSAACLEKADQADSPLKVADTVLIGARKTAASSNEDYAARNVSLIERTGDSALIELASQAEEQSGTSKPASVLVIKAEAGWRLREIFDD